MVWIFVQATCDKNHIRVLVPGITGRPLLAGWARCLVLAYAPCS